MARDSKMMRGDKPFVFTNIRSGEGIDDVIAFLDKYAKDAWIRFDGKNASSYQGFANSLKAIRNKFRKWIEISKANNVKSYSKELKDDIPPIPKVDVYFQYDEGDFRKR